MTMKQWIDLADRETGARLKMATFDGAHFLYIVGLSNNSPKWRKCVETLGYAESPNKKVLSRELRKGERIKASDYRSIFFRASQALLPEEAIFLKIKAASSDARKAQTDEERSLRTELANAIDLGFNADGDRVFETGTGRVIDRGEKGFIEEVAARNSMRPHLFLRAPDAASLDGCADGVVAAMLSNKTLKSDDLDRFIYAVTGRKADQRTPADLEMAFEVIDAASTRALVQGHQTANDAYGDSVRLYEQAPNYTGLVRGKAAMPIPLSVIAQRLLGDTSKQTVLFPNAFDGASFSFLPAGTRIRAFKGDRDLSERAAAMQREGVEWHGTFQAAKEAGADALFYNADPAVGVDGGRVDYKEAMISLRALRDGGRAVLVLAGDDPLRPGVITSFSKKFYELLSSRYRIEDAFEVGRELTEGVGTKSTLRVISLTSDAPSESSLKIFADGMPAVVHSWDEAKARVDQSLALAQVREAESDASIDLDQLERETSLQRPYLSFSKVTEATMMVPNELQTPLQTFMSELEALVGPVDEYVRNELGYAGDEALASRFSAEQMDTMAMSMYRIGVKGRGHILGDETGAGKGRAIAGLVTWALKKGRPVVFVTDKANLFSDLARDARDIGEWGRIRPLVMNADGQIVDSIGDAGVLAAGTKPAEMSRILAGNVPLSELDANVIFTTYSQIANEGSDKAVWLKNQLKDALLIVDEAHVAAGSDSNVSAQIAEMSALAWGVQYASATWAKTPDNLHIFARAFPESVNVATLSETMKRGGTAFAEVFSSMLGREGAFIRREHDNSKLQFTIERDLVNEEFNNKVADDVASVMSALAYVAGDLKRIVTRTTGLNLATLSEAREVRGQAATAKIFKSAFGTGSMLYQVMRRVNVALNAANGVQLALAALERNEKPILVFDDTGEAFVKAAIEEQSIVQEDGSVLVPNEISMPTVADLMLKVLKSLQEVKVADVSAEEADAAGLFSADADADGDDDEDGDAETRVLEALGQPVPPAANAGAAPGADRAAPAAAQVDEGIDVAALVADTNADANADVNAEASGDNRGAARAVDGGAAQKVKAKRITYKRVPFWELEDVSQADRTRFQEGIADIVARIKQIAWVPLVAPDALAAKLTDAGFRVGEISGRSFRLVPSETTPDKYRIVPRPKGKAFVNASVRAFNGGDMDVIMINRSAATGLSLHASPRFPDHRRRNMIVLQAPENPADFSQLLGRANRKDQATFPWVQMASTGIYGELRQLMVQNKKQASMAANVRSDRRSMVNVSNVPDLLNPIGQQVCRAFLADNPEWVARLDMSPKDLEHDSGRDLAQMLTQRVPLLRIVEQRTVYEQLESMFDDAIAQAELEGVNPLKPNEMDVRATLGEPVPLLGFDHKGLGSAFDGAAFAQRMTWTQEFRPMTVDQMATLVVAKRLEMVKAGRAELVSGGADGVDPVISIEQLATAAAKAFEGRARLALAGTKFTVFAEAMLDKQDNPVKQSMARAAWVKENLADLVPGRVVRVTPEVGSKEYWRIRTGVVLEVVPPPTKRESQLAQWRVSIIYPGESGAVTTTLSTLVGRLTVENLQRDVRGNVVAAGSRSGQGEVFQEVWSSLQLGADFLEMHRHRQGNPDESDWPRTPQMRHGWMYDTYRNAFVGERKRDALILTGNMYLASEWAATTKAGNGVIVTDERGQRHRAVLLKSQFKPQWLSFLPARLWMPKMIENFVARVYEKVDESGKAHKAYTSFDSAWKATEGKTHVNAIEFYPQGIVVHVGKGSRLRVMRLLRSAQTKIKGREYPDQPKLRPLDDGGHVVIKDATKMGGRKRKVRDEDGESVQARMRGAPPSTSWDAVSSRSANEYVVMAAETPAQRERAIRMLREGPGLELFVVGALRPLARECMTSYFVERLRAEVGGDESRAARVEELVASLEQQDSGEDALAEMQKIARMMAQSRAADGDGQQLLMDFNTGQPMVLEDEEAADVAQAGVGEEADADEADAAVDRPRMAA